MTYTPFYFFFFNYYRSDVSVSFASGVLCPAPPLPEFPSTVFCAREFRERVKFRSLRRMVSDNSESECFGTRFFRMSIPRHCMPFFFLTLFLAAGLYPAFFFYSLGCHPSHFHSFTHSHKIVAWLEFIQRILHKSTRFPPVKATKLRQIKEKFTDLAEFIAYAKKK